MLQINLVAALAAVPLLLGLGSSPAAAAAPAAALAPPAIDKEATLEPLAATPSAASPSVKVVDTTAEITDPAWFKQAYDAGIRLYVMHSTAWATCDPWHRTEAQLKMALDAGLKIAVYTRDASCWQSGIAAAGPYAPQLQFFALDVEPGSSPVTRAMVDGVKGMGARPVIYSGSHIWPALMGDNTSFADVPLWDTNAGHIDFAGWSADHLAPAPVQYGGWNTAATMRVGVQQKFEHVLNGVPVDLNSFNASFLK